MKKGFIILLIVLALLVFIGGTTITVKKTIDMVDIINAFTKAKKEFGIHIAQDAERIYRLETNHFKSGQFKNTYSPGMEVGKGKTTYPYGWTSLKPFWDKFPQYKPNHLYTTPENQTGITKTFIGFPSLEAAVMTLCYFLTYRKAESWYALDLEKQKYYRDILNKINPQIVNTIS